MAETLSTLSIIAFVISGVFLALAVFFWFLFRISSILEKYLFGEKIGKESPAKKRKAQEDSGLHVHVGNVKNAARSRKETDVLAIRPIRTQDVKMDIMSTVLMGTMPLSDNIGVTAPLNDVAWQMIKPIGGKKLTMLDEVMMIHTDETIETENI